MIKVVFINTKSNEDKTESLKLSTSIWVIHLRGSKNEKWCSLGLQGM